MAKRAATPRTTKPATPAPAAPAANPNVPQLGEQTGKQATRISSFGFMTFPDLKVPPATIETYRKMGRNPTVALAMAVALAPIQSLPFSIISEDPAVPKDFVAFVRSVVDPLLADFVPDALSAVPFGARGFEKVWAVSEGRFVYRKIKPLSVEETRPIVEPDHGEVVGVKNGDVELSTLQSVWFINDDERTGSPYGRSRHENIRETAWAAWEDTYRKIGSLTSKNAGVVPILRFPVGTSPDASGREVSNGEIARAILTTLSSCAGVSMPNQLEAWAEEAFRKGIDVSKIASWQLDFLTATSGPGAELLTILRHYETLMVRGWFLPERAVLEGQFGTKAEASEHGDAYLVIAQQLARAVARVISEQLIDDLVRVNFGREFVGKIRAVAGPISDDEQVFYRTLVTGLLTNPATLPALAAAVDWNSAVDRSGLPKSGETVTLDPSKLTAAAPAGAPGNLPAIPLSKQAEQLFSKLARKIKARGA